MAIVYVLKKEDALRLYSTQAALARALNISRAAVSRWAPGLPIPETYALRLRYVLRPECFRDDEEVTPDELLTLYALKVPERIPVDQLSAV